MLCTHTNLECIGCRNQYSKSRESTHQEWKQYTVQRMDKTNKHKNMETSTTAEPRVSSLVAQTSFQIS